MIFAILISISVLGLILTLSLFSHIRSITSSTKLKKYRSKDKGLADLLNYACVIDDGIILNKNGSLMAGWIYRGKDLTSSTPDEREEVSSRINKALVGLGNGWMLHIDAARQASPKYTKPNENHFKNDITKAIDEERRQLFESIGTLYEGFFVIVVTYFPPLLAEKKFAELMFDDDSDNFKRKSNQEKILTKFKQDCETIESNLSICLDLTRLNSQQINTENGTKITQDEFLSWLQYCITGNYHPVNLPAAPMYIDSLIGGKELYAGVFPMIGNKYIQTVAIDGFPIESHPGILARLAELPIEYRWSNRFIFLDQHQAIAHLEKYRKKWKQKIRGFLDQVFNTHAGAIDLDAMSMVDDAEQALSETKSGLIGQGYYTSVVILMHGNREYLEAITRQVEKEINTIGFSARIETINTMESWLGSLPGHGVENVRRPLVNTLNLADLIPTSTIWTGEQFNPCPFYPRNSPPLMQVISENSSAFRLNLHVDDVGHTLIFGATGAGKSTLIATLAAQAQRYDNARIICFDKGRSLETLTKASNGLHFTIGDKTDDDKQRLQFAPLQLLKDKQNFAWACDWIEMVLQLNNLPVSSSRRNEIENTINNLTAGGNGLSLSDFSNQIQDNDIREVLKSYTIDGSMGFLFDAKEDNLELSNFTCFEIEQLMTLPDKYKLPIMFYLFRQIELSLTGVPAYIFIDEAWIIFGNPVVRDKIQEWLRVNRKKNCAVVMATQSLNDSVQSGLLEVLNESCLTKIYLPNIAAREKDTKALYMRLGLNERQIEIIANSIPKKHYYYVSPKGCRLFELGLEPLSLAFVAVSDKTQIKLMHKCFNEHGANWTNEWLKQKNIHLDNYLDLN